MPGQGAIQSPRDHEKAAAIGENRSGSVGVRFFAVEIVEIDIRHSDDVCAVRKRLHPGEVGFFDFYKIWSAVRIKRYRRQWLCVLDHRGGLSRSAIIDESCRADMDSLDRFEWDCSALVVPCS